MKIAKLQKEIRQIKEAFESIGFCNIVYDLDEIIHNLESNGVKPNPIRLKIFGIVAKYMEDNNQCLPSDFYVLQQLVEARKGWGYATQPIIEQICSIEDLGWDYPTQTMMVIETIKNLRVIKHGNLRFLVKNDLKRSLLTKLYDDRKSWLSYYEEQLAETMLNAQYFEYEENIQSIKAQIKELEKALQSVA